MTNVEFAEHRERLRILADSINDTARMARTSLSLILLAAAYLAITLKGLSR